MDKHMAEPLVPEDSLAEVEIVTEKLVRYKYPSTDQVPAKMIKAGDTQIIFVGF
jgi:hypothetical protein